MKRESVFLAIALSAVALAMSGCPSSGGGGTNPPPQDIVLRPDITIHVAVGNELLGDAYSMQSVVHQSILIQGPLPDNISYLLPLVALDGDNNEAQSRIARFKIVYKLLSGTFDRPTVGSEVTQEYFVTYDSGGNATIRDRLGVIVNPDSILDGLLVFATLRVVNCVAWNFAIGLPICNPWLKNGPLALEYVDDDGPAPTTWPLESQTLLGRLGSGLDKGLTKSQTLAQPMVEVLPSTRWLCEARAEVEFDATLSGHKEREFFDITFLMDFDGDGISNEQEVVDMTNPFDPLSPPRMVTVPSLVGADPADVPDLLADVSLVQNPILGTPQYSTTIARDLVVWQSPAAGSSVLSGSAVQIALSLGPPLTANLSMAFTTPTAGVHVASGTVVRYSFVITNGVAPFRIRFLPPSGSWVEFTTTSRTPYVDVLVSSTAGPGPSTAWAYAQVIDGDGVGTLFPPASQDRLSVSIVVDSPAS